MCLIIDSAHHPQPKTPPACLQNETLKGQNDSKRVLKYLVFTAFLNNYDDLSGSSQGSFKWRAIALTLFKKIEEEDSFCFFLFFFQVYDEFLLNLQYKIKTGWKY